MGEARIFDVGENVLHVFVVKLRADGARVGFLP